MSARTIRREWDDATRACVASRVAVEFADELTSLLGPWLKARANLLSREGVDLRAARAFLERRRAQIAEVRERAARANARIRILFAACGVELSSRAPSVSPMEAS